MEDEKEETKTESNIEETELETTQETENIETTPQETETINENDGEPAEIRSPETAFTEQPLVEELVDSPQQESMEQEITPQVAVETETPQQQIEETDSPQQETDSAQQETDSPQQQTLQPETPPRITEDQPEAESAPVEDMNVVEMEPESPPQEEVNVELNIPAPEVQTTPNVQETVTDIQPSFEEVSFQREEPTKFNTTKEITHEEKEVCFLDCFDKQKLLQFWNLVITKCGACFEIIFVIKLLNKRVWIVLVIV